LPRSVYALFLTGLRTISIERLAKLSHMNSEQLLLAVAVILLVARGLGWAVQRIGQPRVVGEMIAGTTLGTMCRFANPAHCVVAIDKEWDCRIATI